MNSLKGFKIFQVFLAAGLFFGGFPHISSASLFSSQSLADVQKKIANLPEEGKSKRKAILYSELGTFLYKDGRMQEASEAFETALKHKTGLSLKRHIYLFMGKSYESSGRLDKAISAYENAVLYDSRNWRRHRDLASLYEQAQLYPRANEVYNKALELNSKEASLVASKGRVWRKMGLFTMAERELKKARDMGHDTNVIHAELSLVYEGEGRYQDAANEYIQIVSLGSPSEMWAKVVYLALLASDKAMARNGLIHLENQNVSKESLDFYKNLVQLLDSSQQQILSSRSANPAFQSLIESIAETE